MNHLTITTEGDTMLTLDDIVTEIRTIAAESPDFIYRAPEGEGACLYVHTDEVTDEVLEGEGCIVGRALTRLGVNSKTLVENNDRLVEKVLQVLESELAVEPLLLENRREVRWIAYVQSAQDMQETWGEAVASADTNVEVSA